MKLVRINSYRFFICSHIFSIANLLCLSAGAQTPPPIEVPKSINLSGVLRESNIPINGKRNLTFSLFRGSTSCNWSTTYTDVDLVQGNFRVTLIGTGSSQELSDVIKNCKPNQVEISVGSTVLSPRIQISSNAYALSAAHAEHSQSTSTVLSNGAQSGSILVSNGSTYQALIPPANAGKVLKTTASGLSWANDEVGSVAAPIGTVITSLSSTPPSGYLALNGQIVDQNGYIDLFNILGPASRYVAAPAIGPITLSNVYSPQVAIGDSLYKLNLVSADNYQLLKFTGGGYTSTSVNASNLPYIAFNRVSVIGSDIILSSSLGSDKFLKSTTSGGNFWVEQTDSYPYRYTATSNYFYRISYNNPIILERLDSSLGNWSNVNHNLPALSGNGFEAAGNHLVVRVGNKIFKTISLDESSSNWTELFETPVTSDSFLIGNNYICMISHVYPSSNVIAYNLNSSSLSVMPNNYGLNSWSLSFNGGLFVTSNSLNEFFVSTDCKIWYKVANESSSNFSPPLAVLSGSDALIRWFIDDESKKLKTLTPSTNSFLLPSVFASDGLYRYVKAQ